MKIILKGFIVVLSAVVLLDWMAGNALRILYFHQKGGTDYHIIHSMEKTNEDILIFGTSRAQHQYVPNKFSDALGKDCYNVGQAGMNILYTLAVQQAILKRYTPRIMILDIFPIDLLFKSEAEYNRLSYLLPFVQKHEEIRRIVYLRGPFERIKLLSRIYPFNSKILPIIYNNLFEPQYEYSNGYMPLRQTMSGQEKSEMTYSAFVLDQNKADAFSAFLENGLAAGCKVYVVISPLYVDPNASYLDAYRVAREIVQRFDLEIWDYGNDLRFADAKLFKDPIHLNATGAELFSSIVAARLQGDLNFFSYQNFDE